MHSVDAEQAGTASRENTGPIGQVSAWGPAHLARAQCVLGQLTEPPRGFRSSSDKGTEDQSLRTSCDNR